MNSSSYILLTSGVQLLGLVSFLFVHLAFRKKQAVKYYAVVKRITSVRTKDEFHNIFRKLAGNEVKTLSSRQKNEILNLADILEANLI